MTVASSSADKKVQRLRLSAEKGNELLGLVLTAAGLLLAVALGSYHPQDPSILHRMPEGPAPLRNLAGPVGAQVAAVGFALLGLPCLLVPVLLLATGWRRLRRRQSVRIVGRGFGALLLLAALPALSHLLVGDVGFRGAELDSGGALGRLFAEQLLAALGFAGALVVLLAVLAVGTALLVQSTLGETLVAWRRRLAASWQDLQLSRARRAERREKERARRRVVAKHLERVVEERRKSAGGADPEAEPPHLDLPLRVVERAGEAGFLVRKVRGVPPAAAQAAAALAEAELDAALPAHAAGAPARGAAPRAGRPVPQQVFTFVEEASKASHGALPPINLLQMSDGTGSVDERELLRMGEVIRARCAEFGVEGTVEGINPGPVITVFEFQPAPGVKVSQIVNLQDDLALAMKAESVRIDRMPGRSTLGIEVPSRERAIIRLGSLVAEEQFRHSPSVLTMALGTTIQGRPYYADLTTMPHLLVAGATGSGKSVGLQSMITSIIYKATRQEVQFIFIDPKRIELGVYGDIPHLKAEVVVDPQKAANALRWAVAEMERRYRLLAEVHVRSIAYYNHAITDPQQRRNLALSESEGEVTLEDLKPLPYYVIVIDELADLMMVASADVETSIARLAQMARAVGIHLIVATQRPSVDVLTGTIKANFPCRIAFATATRHDSRVILDQIGAEKLLGKGDMLLMPPGSSRLLRLHGAYVSEQETAGLVRWLKKQGPPDLDPEVLLAPEKEGGAGGGGDNDDELYDQAARLVVAERQASASFLQRRMRIGFSRAARLIDMMERDDLLGPPQGSKPREVLVTADYFEEIDRARDDL